MVMVKKDGCLVIPLGRNGGVCIALDGKYFSREAIHITLQEAFWVVSIAWILIQVIDKLINKKKK